MAHLICTYTSHQLYCRSSTFHEQPIYKSFSMPPTHFHHNTQVSQNLRFCYSGESIKKRNMNGFVLLTEDPVTFNQHTIDQEKKGLLHNIFWSTYLLSCLHIDSFQVCSRTTCHYRVTGKGLSSRPDTRPRPDTARESDPRHSPGWHARTSRSQRNWSRSPFVRFRPNCPPLDKHRPQDIH